eukprot:jgi/Galph1/4818/GphlegSOOS_G3462.1
MLTGSEFSNYENEVEQLSSISSLTLFEQDSFVFPQKKFMNNLLHNVEGDLAGEDPYGFVLAEALTRLHSNQLEETKPYSDLLPKPPPKAAHASFNKQLENSFDRGSEEKKATVLSKKDNDSDSNTGAQYLKSTHKDDSSNELQREHASSVDTNYCHQQPFETSYEQKSEETVYKLEKQKEISSVHSRNSGELSGRFIEILAQPLIDLQCLKRLAWNGVPRPWRSTVWKLLVGYWPISCSRRNEIIERKRRDYKISLQRAFSQSRKSVTEQERSIWRQINLDIPRICADYEMFRIHPFQDLLKRILFVWAIRHPACGYVQGMSDVLTPFVYVVISDFYHNNCSTSCSSSMWKDIVSDQSVQSIENDVVLHLLDIEALNGHLNELEADIYWCFCSMLEKIQDFYTFSQPGIQRRIQLLERLIARVCPTLWTHFQNQDIEVVQFAFRWLNCLLIRELPFPVIVRLWDTVLCEEEGFENFYIFICASLLYFFESKLLSMDFQGLLLFLQNLPREIWTDVNVKIVISQAYLWKELFTSSRNNLFERI